MLNYLRQLKAEEKQVNFDVILLNGHTLPQVEIEEVDSVGLLTLCKGCRRLVPWAAVSHIVVNEGECDELE